VQFLQNDPKSAPLYKGWGSERDKLVYRGNLADLHPSWGGATWVDVIAGNPHYGSSPDQPLYKDWWWGHSNLSEADPWTATSSSQAGAGLWNPDLADILAQLRQQSQQPNPPMWGELPPPATFPAPTVPPPTYAVPAPMPNAAPRTQAPSVSGAPSPLALQSGGLSQALQLMQQQLPALIRSRGVNDPLVLMILRQLGGSQ
jgi:hypothetical protein